MLGSDSGASGIGVVVRRRAKRETWNRWEGPVWDSVLRDRVGCCVSIEVLKKVGSRSIGKIEVDGRRRVNVESPVSAKPEYCQVECTAVLELRLGGRRVRRQCAQAIDEGDLEWIERVCVRGT